MIIDPFRVGTESVWSTTLPPHYKRRLFEYIEGKLTEIFHQRILEPLYGQISIKEGQQQTIVIRLITTIHFNTHVVGITIPADEFLSIEPREIADKLTHSFLHSFGSLALSAFLSSQSKLGEEE